MPRISPVSKEVLFAHGSETKPDRVTVILHFTTLSAGGFHDSGVSFEVFLPHEPYLSERTRQKEALAAAAETLRELADYLDK